MPIVVRELIIRARLEEAEPPSHANGSTRSGHRSTLSEADVERIVALCVEKVMENLERKKER